MTVITVRNLDEQTRDRLKVRARAHGRSMEAEARLILAAAVAPPEDAGPGGLGSQIVALFAGVDGDGIAAARSGEAARVASLES